VVSDVINFYKPNTKNAINETDKLAWVDVFVEARE
jgi:hypothetical protein